MTAQERAVMQHALDAIETDNQGDLRKAMANLRQVLAKPEPGTLDVALLQDLAF